MFRRRAVEEIDDAGIAPDRCCQDMSIINVWEPRSGDQFFVTGNESIRNGAVHEIGRAVQLVHCQIRPLQEQIALPFVVNLRAPPGTETSHKCVNCE